MPTPLPTFHEEHLILSKGLGLIAGIDEVGRGPVAGPIVASAVVLDLEKAKKIPEGFIKDSKKIAEKKRIKSVEYIKNTCIAYAYGQVDTNEIDKIGIGKANILAYQRAVQNLSITPNYILLDGNLQFKSSIPVKTIIKGDLYCFSIAAASILAKVYRDTLMRELSKDYPQYGFERNKGYGTAEHMSAIKRLGVTPVHRKTFLSGISI